MYLIVTILSIIVTKFLQIHSFLLDISHNTDALMRQSVRIKITAALPFGNHDRYHFMFYACSARTESLPSVTSTSMVSPSRTSPFSMAFAAKVSTCF